jgi:hypothetical protein
MGIGQKHRAGLLSSGTDGGWALFWAKDYSSLDATCFRLAQAEHLGITSTNAAVLRAIEFLAQRQFPDGRWEEKDEDGRLPSFLHAHWLAGSLWHRTGWQEAAERVFGYLHKRISDLAVSHCAWLLTTLFAGGRRIAHPLVDQALDILEISQQDNRRWMSEDGPPIRTCMRRWSPFELCSVIEGIDPEQPVDF